MRKVIAEKIGVRAGQLVRISCKWRKKAGSSSVAVYAREGGGDFAPFVPHDYIEASDLKSFPIFQLMGGVLCESKKRLDFEFSAPAHMDIRIYQEVDLADDATVTGKVLSYGKFALSIRRIYGNFKRGIRSFHAAHVWPQ